MWIEISKDVFENSNFKSLNYLYQILSWYPENSSPRYKLFINLGQIKDLENYQKIKNTETVFDELIKRQFDEFVLSNPSGTPKDYKITNQKKKNHFNVEEAIRFFNQPVSIILENNKNDSYFITAIINYFDSTGLAKVHLKNGWIRFENAGGCSNIENFLKGILHVFENLALKNNRNLSDYFRGLIILDSDLEYPGQPPKQETLIKKLTTLKDKEGAVNLYVLERDKIHVLKKRMMENYMPDEVFEDLKTNPPSKNWLTTYKKWMTVYLHLSSVQKDYLKMERGKSFSSDPNVSLLYKDVSTENKESLNNGFYYIDKKEHKNKFPLFFIESPRVNKHTLNERCGTGELQDIFDKISKLL